MNTTVNLTIGEYTTLLRQFGYTYKNDEITITDDILRFSDISEQIITKVIFNGPATIVFWKDKTKTVVKCDKDDVFDPEKGLAMAISKKFFGNKGNYYNIFKIFLHKAVTPITCKEDTSYFFDGSKRVKTWYKDESKRIKTWKAYKELRDNEDIEEAMGYLGEILND